MADRQLQSRTPVGVRLLGWLGWAGLLGYLGWNGFWLAGGRVPPSIWQALTGWPAPTTGMTRAWLALVEGRWLESLCWNPLAVPVGLAWAATAWWAASCWVTGRKLQAPSWFLPSWLGLLGLAWMSKFVLGRAWW